MQKMPLPAHVPTIPTDDVRLCPEQNAGVLLDQQVVEQGAAQRRRIPPTIEDQQRAAFQKKMMAERSTRRVNNVNGI